MIFKFSFIIVSLLFNNETKIALAHFAVRLSANPSLYLSSVYPIAVEILSFPIGKGVSQIFSFARFNKSSNDAMR